MALERGEQEHAVAAQVAAIAFDDPFDDGADQAFVVVAIHAAFPLRDALGDLAGIVVVIEHRVVQVLLGGEVAEDDGFGDAGGGGDFLGGGAGESFAGEEVERRFDELKAAVAGGEAEGWGTGSFTGSIVSQYLLTVKRVYFFWGESAGESVCGGRGVVVGGWVS